MNCFRELLDRWNQQARDCRADAARLGDTTVGRELLRDAAQYEQSAHQVEKMLERQLVTPVAALTVKWRQQWAEGYLTGDPVIDARTEERWAAYDACADDLEAALSIRTPAAQWRERGEEDPHGERYDCERALLPRGDLTDDGLANAVYLYDHHRGLDSIGWLTAAKERIRWLSRALIAALARLAEAEELAERNRNHWHVMKAQRDALQSRLDAVLRLADRWVNDPKYSLDQCANDLLAALGGESPANEEVK